MVSLSKEVLTAQGGCESTARLGFHWPPFHTVSHLHLHIIAPEGEMGFIARGMFKKDSFWFVSVSIWGTDVGVDGHYMYKYMQLTVHLLPE